MQVYEYADPSGVYRLTEAEIIAEYFGWWSSQMCRADKADEISHENCIYDFCVVHWAYKVEAGKPAEKIS